MSHRVSKRGDEAARRGGLGVAEFVQAKAEDLPFGEETFDVVTCTYLLHEVSCLLHLH